MDEENDKTKAPNADIGGLHKEGVDILSDEEIRNSSKNVTNSENLGISNSEVRSVMSNYLKEFDKEKTGGEEKDGDRKLFSTASPFIPQQPKIESRPVSETTPIQPTPEVLKAMGSLSNASDKVLGEGPTAPKPISKVPEDLAKRFNDEENLKITSVSKLNDPSIKPLRTFKSDAEEAVRYKGMSAVSISLAETKKELLKSEVSKIEQGSLIPSQRLMDKPGETKPIPIEIEEGPTRISWLAVFISIVLLGGGGTALYFVYNNYIKNNPPPVPVKPIEKSIVRTDGLIEFKVDPNVQISNFISAINSSDNESASSITRLKPISVLASSTVSVKAEDFFRGVKMPDRITRALGTDYMIGFYFSDVKIPFVIFKVTYFENAFAGMIDWEKTIKNDLRDVIGVVWPETGAGSSFRDLVVLNKDTRVLSDGKNDILYYSLIDKSTVVITFSKQALEEIIKRYTEARVTK